MAKTRQEIFDICATHLLDANWVGVPLKEEVVA